MRILTVVGTRPEAIKMAPVALAITGRSEMEHVFVTTGQHGRLMDQALAAFGIERDLDLALGRAKGTLDDQIATLGAPVAGLITQLRPALVLVQGDTTSARAAAMAAHGCGVPVGHVEAGLRSGNPREPWPEEENRIAIDRIATLLFAPTAAARDNLLHERVGGRIWVTGNTGIDALFRMRARLDADPRRAGRLPLRKLGGKRLVLATCHRRENIPALADICAAVAAIAARGDVEIVLPVHPNRAVRPVVRAALGNISGVTLVPPLRYPAMVALLDRCALLLTDSGGLQEEAPALAKPTLVMRNVTERQEGVESGNLRLVGTDPARIVAEANRLLDDPVAHRAMSRATLPFGDGTAADAILDAIAGHFATPRLVSASKAYPEEPRSKVA